MGYAFPSTFEYKQRKKNILENHQVVHITNEWKVLDESRFGNLSL